MRVTLRPTIAADLPHCIGEPLPHRIKAITALLGDQVIGIGGIGFRPDGICEAFVQQAPEAKSYPVAFHRAGLMAMRLIISSKLEIVWARADPNNPTALRWLKRLGFEQEEGLTPEGRALFAWRRRDIRAER